MEDEVEVTEVESVDFESLAAKDGWAPLDHWKGDPDKWKTAEQFVEDGKNINGILKSKVDRLDQRVNELLESNRKFNEFSQRSLKKEQDEKKSLIKQLEQVRKTAITEGDGDAFAKADEQIQELRQPQSNGIDPLAEAWLSDNSWYKTDPVLSTFADGLVDRVIQEGYRDKAYYSELTKRTKEAFPERFENPKRKQPNSVEDGGEQVVVSKDRTFDKLPKEAKSAYAMFKRDIPGFTKEQFVANYDWE